MPGPKLLNVHRQLVASLFERLYGRDSCREAICGYVFQERFHGVAEFAECFQPCHSGPALERVDVPLQVLYQLDVGKLVTPGVEVRITAFEDFLGLLHEDLQNSRVEIRQLVRKLGFGLVLWGLGVFL